MQKWVQEISTNEEQVSLNEEPTDVHDQNRQGSAGSVLVNILLGIWVIISPFVLGIHSSKGIWNNVIVGIIVGILAIIRWSVHQHGWSWLNLILGIWLVISPFALFLGSAAMWNNVILGIIIAALALTNTYSKVPAKA